METRSSTKLTETAIRLQKRRSIHREENSNNLPDLRQGLEKILIKRDEEVKAEIDTFMSYPKSQIIRPLDGDNTTVLHLAFGIFSFDREEEKNLLNQMLEKYPEVILRSKSGEFEGQLPLHMAICHGHTFLVDLLLGPLPQEKRMECLHKKATGKAFALTVMVAELPLSVATLTGNKDMVEHLLRYGTRLTETNSKGENVLHSIISYAYMYPEKADLMLEMIIFLMDKSSVMKELNKKNPDENLRWCMFLAEDTRGKNPLQVALQLGQLDIFKYILQKTYVYSHGDGLFGVEQYDMTDVDKSLTLVPESSNEHRDDPNRESELISEPRNKEKERFPLDHLFFLNTKTSMAFLNYHPLSRLIRQRWIGYRNLFYITFFIHLVIMIMLTVAAVLRAERRPVGGLNTDIDGVNNTTDVMPDNVFTFPAKGVSDQFVITTGFVSLVVAIMYILQEILRLYKGRLQLQIKHIFNPFSNNMFRLLIFVFALSLVADFIATWFSVYDEDFSLLFAIFIGWFLLLFFLRAMRRFCQFTSLVQTAMFDILRFSVIILIELVAFTTVLYVLIRGSKLDANEDGKEFQERWIKALFLVFQQIFGIGDLPLSNIRNRLIVNIVYIFFIVMTTVLMLNALIAIMSNTCTELFNSNDGTAHLRFHQYSIIRFFESILPDRYVMLEARKRMVEIEKFRYDPKKKKMYKRKRFLLPISSLRSISKNSVTISPDSADTQQNNYSNKMTEKRLQSTRDQNMTKTDSIEIHHLRLGLCDNCHSKYVLPRSKLNKTVPSG